MSRKPNRWPALAAGLAGTFVALLAVAWPAWAAETGRADSDSGRADSVRQRYEADRAACLSGRTGEDLQNCLREAGAAAQAARRGKLLEGADENYRQNALARCAPLPAEQREACRMRIEGAGTVVGSVQEGGLYRELVIREPASASSPAATPPAPASPPAATPAAPPPAAPAVPAAAAPPAASTGAAPSGPTFTPVQPIVPGRAVAVTPSAANQPPPGSLQISPPSTPVMQAPPPPAIAPQPALVEPGNAPPSGARAQ
ncbi:MAG: hypothetical protein M9885_08075 [Burkholderiaceae bacterium]|nr:hypothetical protein [Burkholderiaceae bacterium]